MASPRAHPDAAPSGPPVFADRAQAGLLLGAAVRDALASFTPSEKERRQVSARPAPALPGGPVAGLRVFALPRGGVPVAAGVAAALGVPLDVLMVRKIGHPEAPELGLGAIAEDGAGGAGEPFFDPEMLREAGLTAADLAPVVARERAELARRAAVYGRRPVPGRDPQGTAASSGNPEREPKGAPRPEERAGSTGPECEPKGAPRPEERAGSTVILVDDGLATGVTARAALRAVRARGPVRAVLAVPVAAPAAIRAVGAAADGVVALVTPRTFRSVGEWYADFRQLTDDDVLAWLRTRQ
jgi:putative phosphoribosyl transferase